jgi:hypothetical protein
MNAPNDNTAAKGLPGWRLSPPRPGMHRLISPWEYRHLRFSGGTRLAAGGFQLGIGLVLLSLGRGAGTDQERRKMYRLSAWFLVPAALNLAGGTWYITIASSAPARTLAWVNTGRGDDARARESSGRWSPGHTRACYGSLTWQPRIGVPGLGY